MQETLQLMSKYFVVFGVTGIIETDPKESDMTK